MQTSFIICTFFLLTNSFGQKLDKDIFVKEGFSRQIINLNFEKNCKGKATIKRKNKNVVTFMFFQVKSDTIAIYLNGKKVLEKYITHDSDLVSTNYTGVDFTYEYPNKENKIIIVYQHQKSFIEFTLDKHFPLYGIYFLDDKKFYVTGRKCQMIIK
jgi:hypothetical protein